MPQVLWRIHVSTEYGIASEARPRRARAAPPTRRVATCQDVLLQCAILIVRILPIWISATLLTFRESSTENSMR